MFICFLSLFVSIQVSDAYVNVLSIVVFFSLNFSFSDIFLFLKNFCGIKYVLLALCLYVCLYSFLCKKLILEVGISILDTPHTIIQQHNVFPTSYLNFFSIYLKG